MQYLSFLDDANNRPETRLDCKGLRDHLQVDLLASFPSMGIQARTARITPPGDHWGRGVLGCDGAFVGVQFQVGFGPKRPQTRPVGTPEAKTSLRFGEPLRACLGAVRSEKCIWLASGRFALRAFPGPRAP